jgi:hypothetical protein
MLLFAYDPRFWMPIGFEVWHAMLDPFGLVPQEASPPAQPDEE